MKKTAILFAILLASVSCSKTSLDSAQLSKGPATISIPVTVESEGIDGSTKAYLADGTDTWNFTWEDGDHFGYFQYRRGIFYNQGTAEVDKRPYSVDVVYPATDFKSGDAIFSYLQMPDGDAELADQGIYNDDPRNFYFVIPEVQLSSNDPETYDYAEDFSFQIANINSSRLTMSQVKGVSTAEGIVPKSGTLSFKIVGYNTDILYACGGDASDLTIDAYGNASVTVSFDAFGPMTNNKSTVTSTVEIFVADYPDYRAEIPVSVTATYTSGIVIPGVVDGRKVSFVYSVGTPTGASVVLQHFDVGDTKPYPVRNCMPCVSKQLTITPTHLQNPELIQSSMTVYMLGSVIQFRPYAASAANGLGETLLGVQFFSQSGPCAGASTYDLVGSNLTLTNMTAESVMSLDAEGGLITSDKTTTKSIYMVIAPGTYASTLAFITDQNVYIFDVAAKDYSRATKKILNVNLANATTVIPLADYFSEGGEDTGVSEDEDEL